MQKYKVKYSTLNPIDIVDNHFENVRRKRILSLFIDLVIFSSAYSIIAFIIYVANKDNFDINSQLGLFISFWFLYLAFHLSTSGMTFGMRYTKLRLISNSGNKPNQLATLFLPMISTFIYVTVLIAPSDLYAYFTGNQKNINPFSFWSVVLLFLPLLNSKKRALQDYICGMVYIRSDI